MAGHHAADRARVLRSLLRVLTPIAKSWPSQLCLAANDLVIQVHGGAGYTRDYDVEQHYRDNRLNPIHEGTHGIQSLDLLGRAVTADNGAALSLLLDTIGETIAAAGATGDAELGHFGDDPALATQRIATSTALLWKSGDPQVAPADSAAYLEAFGHVVPGWIRLEQAVAAHGYSGVFYEGKRVAARYLYRWELPRTTPLFDLLDSLDRTTLDLDPAAL